MAKKDKKKEKKKHKDEVLPAKKGPKSKCCHKYEKGEHKRCKRCPLFDMIKKVA